MGDGSDGGRCMDTAGCILAPARCVHACSVAVVSTDSRNALIHVHYVRVSKCIDKISFMHLLLRILALVGLFCYLYVVFDEPDTVRHTSMKCYTFRRLNVAEIQSPIAV